MNPRLFLQVDPATLHLPTTRSDGPDLLKSHRQVSRFGRTVGGMPVIDVYRGSDGGLMIYNGVTRASRVAKLVPGQLVTVEVIDDLRHPVGHLPTVKEKLP